jgi:hypothetical protein
LLRRSGGPATWLSAADSASGSSGSVERSGSARARRSRSPRQRDGGRRHGLLGAVGKRAGRRGEGTARGALLGPTPPRWAVGVEWALGRRRRRLDRPACACGESVLGLEADIRNPPLALTRGVLTGLEASRHAGGPRSRSAGPVGGPKWMVSVAVTQGPGTNVRVAQSWICGHIGASALGAECGLLGTMVLCSTARQRQLAPRRPLGPGG